MANYKIAEAKTALKEGGFANDPDDTGKLTLNGISSKHWPNWEGWPRLNTIMKRVGNNAAKINAEVRKDPVLLEMISTFYKRNFWDVLKLDQIKYQSIADELFDTGVNMGTSVAAKFLQEALNLCNKNGVTYGDIAVDGQIGPNTLRTLNEKANEIAVLNTINMLQGEKYLDIMRKNKTQEKFWQSWLSRILINGRW